MPFGIDINRLFLKKEEIDFLKGVKSFPGILESREALPSHLDKVLISPKTILNHPEILAFFQEELQSQTITDYLRTLVRLGKKGELVDLRIKLRGKSGGNGQNAGRADFFTQILLQDEEQTDFYPGKRVQKLNFDKIKKLKELLDRDNRRLGQEKMGYQEKLADLRNRIEKNNITLGKRKKDYEALNKEYHVTNTEYKELDGIYRRKLIELDEKQKKAKNDLSDNDEPASAIQTVYSQGKKIYVDDNFRPLDQDLVESKLSKYKTLERIQSETREEKRKWYERVKNKKRKLEDVKNRLLTSEKMIEYFEHVNDNCKRTEERLLKEIRVIEEGGWKSSGFDTVNDIITSCDTIKKHFEKAMNGLAVDVDFVEKRVKPFSEAFENFLGLKKSEENYKEDIKNSNRQINDLKSSLDRNSQQIREFIHKKKKRDSERSLWDKGEDTALLAREYSSLESFHQKTLNRLKEEIDRRKRLVNERKDSFEKIKDGIKGNEEEIRKAGRDFIDMKFRLSTLYYLLSHSMIDQEIFSDTFLFLFLKTDVQNRTLKEMESEKYDFKEELARLRPRQMPDLESNNINFYKRDCEDLERQCKDLKRFLQNNREYEETQSALHDERLPEKEEKKQNHEIKGLSQEVVKLKEELSNLSTQNRLFLEELSSIKNTGLSSPLMRKGKVDIQKGIDLLTERLGEITKEDIFDLLAGHGGGGTKQRLEDIYDFIRNLIGELFRSENSSFDTSVLKRTIETKVSDMKDLFHTLDKTHEIVLESRIENEKLRMKMSDLSARMADNLLQNKQTEKRFLEEIEKKDKKIEELSEKIEKLSLQLLQNDEAKSSPRQQQDNVVPFKKKDENFSIFGFSRKARSSSVKTAISTLILFSGVIYHLVNQASDAKIMENDPSAYFMTSNMPPIEMVSESKQDKEKMYLDLASESPKKEFPLMKDEFYLGELKRVVRVRDFVYSPEKINDAEYVTEAVFKNIRKASSTYRMMPEEFITFINGVRDTSVPFSMSLLRELKNEIEFLNKEYGDFIADLTTETGRIDSMILVSHLDKVIHRDERYFFKRIYDEFVDLGMSKKEALFNIIHNERLLKEKNAYFRDSYKILYKGTIRPIRTLEEMSLEEFKQIAIPYIESRYRIFANHKGFKIPRTLNEYVESMAENIYISAKRFNIPVTSLMTIAHQETFYLNILGDNKKSASPFQIYRPTKVMILENMRRDGFKVPQHVHHLENHLSLASYMAAYHFAELMELYSVELDVKNVRDSSKKIVYDLNRSTSSYNGGKKYYKQVFLKQLELQKFMEQRLQSGRMLS